MPKIIAITGRNALRRLFSRRGSILIMVVAVLVLLALMGTAYISVARIDRKASGSMNESSITEVLDQLLPSIVQQAQDVIRDDVWDLTLGYRPFVQPDFDNWDYASFNWEKGTVGEFARENDSWLSARMPYLVLVSSWPTTELVVWRSLGRPLNQPDPGTGSGVQAIRFETPYSIYTQAANPTVFQAFPAYPNYGQDISTSSANYTAMFPIYWAPSDLAITYPANYSDTGLAGKTRVFPALMPYHYDVSNNSNRVVLPDGPPNNRPIKFLAGDADGDGVADAGLWKVSTIGEITFYAATRIIDNNSAINVNTAWSRSGDFSANPNSPSAGSWNIPAMWVFPESVGLLELMPDYNVGQRVAPSMLVLNQYKFNDTVNTAPNVSLTPINDPVTFPSASPESARTDFVFLSQMEAHYAMISSRLDNVGFKLDSGPAANRLYQAFTADNNLDLMYRFGMMNPSSTDPTGTIEARLLNTTGEGIYKATPNYTPNTPQTSIDSRFRFLPPTEQAYWYNYSYNFDTVSRGSYPYFGTGLPPTLPIRSLLTTSNPVSNLISGNISGGGNVPNEAMLPYGHKGRWHPQYAYKAGDLCYFNPPGSNQALIYFAMNDNQNVQPNTSTAFWRQYVQRGVWKPSLSYLEGHAVRFDPGGGTNYKVYIATAPASGAGQNPPGAPWYPVKGYTAPPKVSLNTAPFGELFRGFWNVMTGPGDTTPFNGAIAAQMGAFGTEVNTGTSPGTFNNPYVGMQFKDQLGLPNAALPLAIPFEAKILPADTAPFPPTNEAKMFRSAIRSAPNLTAPYYDPTTRRLSPLSMMQLRAAIAAVNAEDLRDADNDVTGRRIVLPIQTGLAAADVAMCDVVVYGTEAQPYITEVFANTDTISAPPNAPGINPNGYVAIELYNPYPFDIPLTNWRLVVLNRLPVSPGAAAGAGFLDDPNIPLADSAAHDQQVLVDFSDPGGGSPYLTPVVPAQGFLLLENYVQPQNATDYSAYVSANSGRLAPAVYRPGGCGLPITQNIPSSNQGNAPSSANVRTNPMPQLNVAYLPLPAVTSVNTPGPAVPHRTVFNQEMVFMKRRKFDGTVTPPPATPEESARTGYTTDDPTVNAAAYIRDYIPVDSFDFTGLVLNIAGFMTPNDPPQVPSNVFSWHYSRGTDPAATPPLAYRKAWHFVYPGRYDATNTIVQPTINTVIRARQAGTRETYWNPSTGTDETDAWDGPDDIDGWGAAKKVPTSSLGRPGPPRMSLGTDYGLDSITTPSSNHNEFATYPTSFPIQLAYNNFAPGATPGNYSVSIGQYPLVTGGPVQFPFGGFMRTGEVLYVPFIGAYRITIQPDEGTYVADTIVELNSVTMDAAMAEDTYTIDDPIYALAGGGNQGVPLNTGAPTEYVEQIGRFCAPWNASQAQTYSWASDVFDYFTAIQNHHDDFMPNVDPARYAGTPRAVKNSPGVFENTDQDWIAGTQGLININTADWKALSALPLVITGGFNVDNVLGSSPPYRNEVLAKAIVYYRDVDADGAGNPHGPFKSLFELNDVVDRISAGNTANGFQNMMGNMNFSSASFDATDGEGDFTPWDDIQLPGTPNEDGVRLDFEERYLNIIRLSNLLTTRSDTFTCYILLQAWKDPGTATPQLVGERRAAFTVDRSTLSSSNSEVKVLTVPTR